MQKCKVSEINGILHFTQKFKMAIQNGGKTIFGESRQMTLWIPWGSNIRRNHSISHRFWDKRVFVFYEEIQDGRPKWQENDF